MNASTDAVGVSCLSCLMHPFSAGDRSRHHDEENHRSPVVGDQPASQPRLMALSDTEHPRPSWKHKVHTGSPSQTSFSVRSKRPDASLRHLQISEPFEFRRLDSRLPLPGCQPSPPTRPFFRPLELSILTRENELLPILPCFNFPSPVPSPPVAHLPDRPRDAARNGYANPRQKSHSAASFHIPRRPVYEGSPSTVQEEMPPSIPPRSPERARAYTNSEMEAVKERVAIAMIEVEELQRKIDELAGRQGLCDATGRPSTCHVVVRTTLGKVPSKASLQPPIYALPPAAPSFAERLNAEVEQPKTAPVKASVHANPGQASNNAPTASRTTQENRPPPVMQPLPLAIRPPLRKKKSFSLVSTWLFSRPEHGSAPSSGSATNLPRPVSREGGLAQCLSPGEMSGRRTESFGTTISTWETDDEDRTAPTTWSPESSPAAKQEEPMVERSATFGKNSNRPGLMDVGVAI